MEWKDFNNNDYTIDRSNQPLNVDPVTVSVEPDADMAAVEAYINTLNIDPRIKVTVVKRWLTPDEVVIEINDNLGGVTGVTHGGWYDANTIGPYIELLGVTKADRPAVLEFVKTLNAHPEVDFIPYGSYDVEADVDDATVTAVLTTEVEAYLTSKIIDTAALSTVLCGVIANKSGMRYISIQIDGLFDVNLAELQTYVLSALDISPRVVLSVEFAAPKGGIEEEGIEEEGKIEKPMPE